MKLDSVLFDLDGTLIDTAGDMAAACNALRIEEGLEPVDPALIRPHVSRGSVGVISVGMPPAEDSVTAGWRERFLELYRERLTDSSTLFEGMERVLTLIESRRRCWGVVTNKPGWLAEPLLEALGLTERCCAVVSGDTLAQRKPHPAPLLHAMDQCGVAAERCLYVGDDVRDIIAAHAAGARSAAALWGYIAPDQNPEQWGAHHSLDDLAALETLLLTVWS
ncbi:MAG: HAD-IA family hydrolase [Pseudomonadota bacterium]